MKEKLKNDHKNTIKSQNPLKITLNDTKKQSSPPKINYKLISQGLYIKKNKTTTTTYYVDTRPISMILYKKAFKILHTTHTKENTQKKKIPSQ